MKLKRILCMLMAAMVLSAMAVYTAFAEEAEAKGNVESAPVETAVEYAAPKDAIAALGLENPCEVDEDGNVALEEDVLIDLILPKVLGGQELTSISAKSFAGCPYIRSVVVPKTILEIGEGAFADCEFLETIYVIGHSEEDLTLGSNWNGNAEVVFVVDEVEEDEAPAEDEAITAEEQKAEDADDKEEAPAESQPSDEGEVKDANTSEPADSAKENDGAEEKAPAEENDTDDQEKADAQQPDDNEEKSVPSGDAGEEAPQSNESVSAEGNDGAEAPAESSVAPEA